MKINPLSLALFSAYLRPKYHKHMDKIGKVAVIHKTIGFTCNHVGIVIAKSFFGQN